MNIHTFLANLNFAMSGNNNLIYKKRVCCKVADLKGC